MTETTQPYIFNFEGINNLRDIGGYVTRSGQTVRHKSLLRSGNLDQVPLGSQQKLLELGLQHIIDLRDEWEQRSYPDIFADNPSVQYRNLPFMGDTHLKDDESQRFMNEAENLSVTYIFLLENCTAQVARVMKMLAGLPENECALIHCAAGKDRTGLIIALILSVLGVPAQTIIEDYAVTSLWSSQWREILQPDPDETVQQRRERDASANKETMRDVLAWLEAQYGGAIGYLSAVGCDETVLNSLRARLLDGC